MRSDIRVLVLFASHLTDACSENYTFFLKKDERLAEPVGAAHDICRVQNTSTIAAIVTSLGGPPGAVGIVRLSGPSAVAIASRVFRPTRKKKSTWQPVSHVVEYGMMFDTDGNVIDEVYILIYSYPVLVRRRSLWTFVTALCLQVLVVPMLAPRSYTREDVIELQCHGSEVCLRRVLRTCLEAGARLAEPGPLRSVS